MTKTGGYLNFSKKLNNKNSNFTVDLFKNQLLNFKQITHFKNFVTSLKFCY